MVWNQTPSADSKIFCGMSQKQVRHNSQFSYGWETSSIERIILPWQLQSLPSPWTLWETRIIWKQPIPKLLLFHCSVWCFRRKQSDTEFKFVKCILAGWHLSHAHEELSHWGYLGQTPQVICLDRSSNSMLFHLAYKKKDVFMGVSILVPMDSLCYIIKNGTHSHPKALIHKDRTFSDDATL